MDNPSNADIYRAVGRLEGKLDTHLALGLAKRVSSLERTRAWCLGACAVISAGIVLMFKGTSA